MKSAFFEKKDFDIRATIMGNLEQVLKADSAWSTLSPTEKIKRRRKLLGESSERSLERNEYGIYFHERGDLTKYIEELSKEAMEGSLAGLHILAFMAQETILRLNEIADHDAKFVQYAAAQFGKWPVLCSRQRALSQKDYARLVQIGVPIATEFRINNSESIPKSAARKWAEFVYFRMLEYWMSNFRQFNIWWGPAFDRSYMVSKELPAWYFDQKAKIAKNQALNRPDESKIDQFLEDSLDFADFVQPFSQHPGGAEVVQKRWVELAWQLLLRLSDERPWELEGLSEYKSSKTRSVAAQKKAVHKVFRQAFKEILSGGKQRGRPPKRDPN